MRALSETLLTLPMPILGLLLLGLAAWSRRRLSLALIGSATLAFLVLAMPMAADVLERPLAGGAAAFDAETAATVILVPTAGIFADPEGAWWPSATSIRRAVAGRALQSRTGLPLLLIGGSPAGESESEAATVARQLGLIGADRPASPPVILETGARNSAETARAARLVVERLGGGRLVLVTTPIHMARMAASLRAVGLVVSGHAATAPPPLSRPLGGLEPYLPSAAGLARSGAALHEYLAILWYLLNGDLRFADLGAGA